MRNVECVICGKPMKAKRATKKFCSSSCRAIKCLAKKTVMSIKRPAKHVRVTSEPAIGLR